ncbi:MAG: hypothetical protein ACP5H5_02035 [Pyrobaculum sp.]
MEVFAPTPAELVKTYGARKTPDDKYEIQAINAPWVVKREIDLAVAPGSRYIIEGVKIEGLAPPWEAYVALVEAGGDFGAGFVVARRRRMFSCIYKSYAKPIDTQLAPYVLIKPVELQLTDRENVVECVDRPFRARYLAVFINAPVAVVRRVRVELSPLVKENV